MGNPGVDVPQSLGRRPFGRFRVGERGQRVALRVRPGSPAVFLHQSCYLGGRQRLPRDYDPAPEATRGVRGREQELQPGGDGLGRSPALLEEPRQGDHRLGLALRFSGESRRFPQRGLVAAATDRQVAAEELLACLGGLSAP